MRRPPFAAMCAGMLATIALSGCLGLGGESAVPGVAQPPPAGDVCKTGYSPPTVVFLAREAVPDELEGLSYFATDWGLRQGCFKGTVVSVPTGIKATAYQALVVDVSHDAMLSKADVDLIRAFIAAGKRVAIFNWPLRLTDGSVAATTLGEASNLLGGVAFKQAKGCGDWQYTSAPGGPFQIADTSYRYENFGASVFTLTATGPQRVWAKTLFCPGDLGPVMIEVPQGIVAGFSIAYTISLADNNVRAVAMKRMVVDVLKSLTGPSPALS